MYKARINLWNLHKNLKKDEKAVLVRKVRHTGGANELRHKGRPVQMHRLIRYCKENNILLEDQDTAAPYRAQQSTARPVNAIGQTESAAHELQSLFRSPWQPLRPIVSYDNIRTAEVVFLNLEAYLNNYFTTGLGTWYYQRASTMTAHKGLPSQNEVLVRNERAWEEVQRPNMMFTHIHDALHALRDGFPELAITEIGNASELVKVALIQQDPRLLPYLFASLSKLAKSKTRLAQQAVRFILDMTATSFCDTHPIKSIVHQWYTIDSVADRCCVWRGVIDAIGRFLGVFEDSKLLQQARRQYLWGLVEQSLFKAHVYLDGLYNMNGRVDEEISTYILHKTLLLVKQHRYMEAEVQSRRVLGLAEKAENEVSSSATSSKGRLSWQDAYYCLHRRAFVLTKMDRIVEAKSMWLRAFDFALTALGSDNVDTQLAGSYLDDFLIENGFFEESAALRAQHPWLLLRQKLPPNCL